MILKQICDYFKDFKIKPILIPSTLTIPFLTFTEEEIKKLNIFEESEYGIVRDYKNWLLKNGKIEQEYLLEWYEEIILESITSTK